MKKLLSSVFSSLKGRIKEGLLFLALFASMSTIYASDTQVDGIWYDFNSSTEESVDFSAQGYANSQEVLSYQGTNFSVTFDQGTNSFVPKYYNTGNAIRVYGGGCFIVTSESTITKIVVQFGYSDGSNAISTDVGTFSNGTWRGNSNSVKFTIGGTSGHRRIQKLTVTSSAKTASVTYRGDKYSYSNEYSGSVIIPETVTYNGTTYSVKSIGKSAFCGSSLTSVTIPNSVKNIEEWAFNSCSSLTSVTIPNSVKSIGNNAFGGCSSLTSVTIPNSVTSIGYGVFRNCISLTSVTIPNSVKSIGDDAFRYCSSWTSVTIPNSVTSIGSYAFHCCSSLTSVTIGESVTTIGDHAFNSCSSITSIRCEVATPPTVGISTFHGISKSIPVYVPCECVKAYKTASGWEEFTNIQEWLVEYSIEVYVNDATMGTAKVDINNACGAQISATANIGYHFVRWNDGNTDNPRTLVLTQDTTLIAEFAINQYTITTRASHNERGTTQGDTTITYLEYITISATANYGYHFTQWSDGVTTNPRQVQVTEDKIYTADFEKNTYSVSLSCNEEQGNVEGAKTAEYLDTVTISATPNIGYHFVQWNDGNTDNPRTLVLTQDTTLIAEFAINQYTITTRASHNERGTTQGDTTITYLEYITISATANYGYHFTQWSDGVTTNPRQVQVTEDKIYTADFEKNTYSISLFCNEEQGTVEGVTSAEYLDTVTISAKPNIGYHFVQWNDGNTDNPRTLVLTQDTKLTAEFALSLSGQCGDSLYWEFIEDTLHITGTGAMYNYTSDTAPWKLLVSAIKALTIAEDMTIIGGSAFSGCSFLTSVTINSDVIVSKDYSYSSNISHIFGSQVTEYIIGDGVRGIGECAFDDCSSLTSVTIPNSVTSIGEAAFSGCSSLTSVILPNSVTSIGEWAFNRCSSLTSVTIPNSVKSIGGCAFNGCSSLTSVTIPNSVKSIGGCAFNGCSSLTSVTIPNSVKSIGDDAFSWCSSLASITCEAENPPTIGSDAFYNVSKSIPVYVPCGCVGAYNAKSGWEDFTNIQEPLAEYSIEVDVNDNIMGTAKVDINNACGAQISAKPNFGYHFVQWSDGNTNNPRSLVLTQDTILTAEFALTQSGQCGDNLYWELIDDTLHITGTGAMYDYTYDAPWKRSIKALCIGESVTSIGEFAFSGCSSLTSVIIPNSVTSIGDDAFSGCYSLPVEDTLRYADTYLVEAVDKTLSTCSIKEGTKWVGNNAFDGCGKLTSVTIPNSVTSIGEEAFSNCSSLTSVTIPNSVTSIGYNAFKNCYSLTSVTIGESVTSIGYNAFQGCSSLSSVIIPNSVTIIGGWAFYDCSSLTSVTIPNSVTSIGDDAFKNCYSLTSVPIGKSVTSLGDDAFKNCYSLTSVTIGKSVTSIGDDAFKNCYSLTSVTINSDAIMSRDYSYNSNISHIFGSQVTEYMIGDAVKGIGDEAFYNCDSLTSVTISKSVTSIGEDAFIWCSGLTKTNYTGDIAEWCNIKFGSYAANPMSYSHNFFINDQEIKDLVIPNNVDTINNYAFCNCDSLTSVTIGNSVTSIGAEAFYSCDSLTSVTIGNSVTSIGAEAFYSCDSLTSVTIPNSVTSIGDDAFLYCSSLTSVTINSSYILNNSSSYISNVFGSQVTEYIIGDDVSYIGKNAFYNCDSLTSVTIPNSVTSIGKWAFDGCTRLTSITCKAETPPSVGSYAFSGISKSIPVYVPCECVDAYKVASGWSDFTNIQKLLAEYSIEVYVNDTIMGSAKVDYNTFCEGAQVSITPNVGYHFVQWSDGNTDAIRTLELTQDTILTAEFAQSFSGPCGDNLYWSYDENTKTISITGSGEMYDYTANTQPWLLFKKQIIEVTTTNSVTYIGTSAFEGCARLSKVSLGTGLEEIVANAFAGCNRLYDIYVYATYPPLAEESSFANYNVYVYIPCEYQRDYTLDVVWGKFKFIECLESAETTTDGNVTVVPGYNDITITWPTADNADNYTIVIEKDGEVVCTLTFNADGQLLNIAFAPGRNGNRPAQYAGQAVNGYRFTITGLTEATRYTYSVTTKDAANKTIATYSGEFTTKSSITTSVEDILHSTTNCQKLFRDGQLIIIRDGKTYNAMGQEL